MIEKDEEAWQYKLTKKARKLIERFDSGKKSFEYGNYVFKLEKEFIDHAQVRWYDNIAYIRICEIFKDRDELVRWLAGQTCPTIPNEERFGCCYASDYLRFVKKQPIID